MCRSAQGRMRTRPQSKHRHQCQLGSQHESRKGAVPRERFRLVASGCDVHRVSTMQSKFLDRALSLRMSGHMKRLRVCMHTIVESNVTLQQGARGAEAADWRKYTFDLFLAGSQLAAERSLLWVGQRRMAKQERHQTLDPPGPVAQTRTYISLHGVNAFVSAFASKHPSVFPRHRWTGCDLACDMSACCTSPIWISLCSVVSSAPELSCQRQGRQLQLCSTSQVAAAR